MTEWMTPKMHHECNCNINIGAGGYCAMRFRTQSNPIKYIAGWLEKRSEEEREREMGQMEVRI